MQNLISHFRLKENRRILSMVLLFTTAAFSLLVFPQKVRATENDLGAVIRQTAEPTASGEEITKAVKDGFKEIYLIVRNVSGALAVLAVVACAIMMKINGVNGSQKAKITLIIILVSEGIIWLAPFLVEQVQNIFRGIAGEGSTFW